MVTFHPPTVMEKVKRKNEFTSISTPNVRFYKTFFFTENYDNSWFIKKKLTWCVIRNDPDWCIWKIFLSKKKEEWKVHSGKQKTNLENFKSIFSSSTILLNNRLQNTRRKLPDMRQNCFFSGSSSQFYGFGLINWWC